MLQTILFGFALAIAVACPLSMMFRMRGGRGHSMSHDLPPNGGHTMADTAGHNARIEQLEREVVQLRHSIRDQAGPEALSSVSDGRIPAPIAALKTPGHVH